ncbi:MAG: 3'-5' exonuclease [Patescibacteria group bacterium]
MLKLPKKIVIFDLECTTWDGAAERNWSFPGEHREIVQVGAALVETKNLTEVASMEFWVKPKINPVLSQYFVNLTGIRQEEIDEKGVDFPIMLKDFFCFCCDFQLYCFDSKVDNSRLFDRDVLVENCKSFGIDFPFEMGRFHNVNEIFHQHNIEIKQSGTAPEAFGIKIPARPHNALSDVRGLIIGLRALQSLK